jgi:MFS family permease
VRIPFSRGFILLWQGQLVSSFGNQAFLIATAFYTLDATGSAASVAAITIASTVPLVVLAPLAGAIADAHSRRSILVASDVLRSLAIGGVALSMLWHPERATDTVAWIVAVAGFNGVLAALFAPALQALIPELVANDRLAAANSFNQMSRQAATLTGQALGGLLYASWGPVGLLLFDSASFAYAAVATCFLPRERPRPRGGAGLRRPAARYVRDVRGGMAYVWRRTGMTAVLAIFAGVNCLFMPVVVLLPMYARDVLGAGPEWYGFLLGGAGAGALAGSVLAGVVTARTREPAALVRGCVAGIACAVVLLGASRSPWLALAAFVAVGALSSVINVVVITAFQRGVAPDLRGRVMALVIALSTAAAPLGMALGGLLGELWPESVSLVFVADGLAMAGLVAISVRTPGFDSVLGVPANRGSHPHLTRRSPNAQDPRLANGDPASEPQEP